MSDGIAQGRFAPPRAQVRDQHDSEAHMVTATRMSRFRAVLIDATVPGIIGFVMGIAVALPAYENYVQQHTPGIAPPARGTVHHLTLGWAWLAGLVLLAWLAYNVVLVYRYGQTIGKRAVGIRVARMDGSRVTFARFVFLRWLPLAVLGALPLVRYVVSLLDSLLIFRASSRCLHDDIADTQVVTAASSVDATLDGDPKYAGQGLRTISF